MPAERIGPYRLERRLGTGGMGEVHLAFDERLGRWVALKRIRTGEGAVSASRRKRFRREARAVAKLNHPAIVQIYDILEDPGGDRIVMEYVEGPTIHELLRNGPLDLPTILRVGREVAEGLAEAHAHGIVHRDLKTENVVITRGGHAKILDFGIAKRLWPEGDDASLSMDGTALGTCRTMSPEQASGKEIDHRSDLFSFGVLLYEMCTGVSPFAAENSLATLRQVIHHRQPPARELNPQVPQDLSDLIDLLLEKDPEARIQTAGEVAEALERLEGGLPKRKEGDPALPPTEAAIPAPWNRGFPFRTSGTVPGWTPAATQDARSRGRRQIAIATGVILAAGLAGGLAYFVAQPRIEPIRVAVLEPEVKWAGGPQGPGFIASDVQVAVVQGLIALQGLNVSDPALAAVVEGSAAEVARALAADEVMRLRIRGDGAEWRILVERLLGADGSVLHAEEFAAPTGEPRLLADAVVAAVRRAYPEREPRPGAQALEVRAEDYTEYLRLRRLVENPPPGSDWDRILERIQATRSGSPRFLEAYILEARVARYLGAVRREPALLQRALELVTLARELAPGDPRPLYWEVQIAFTAGDFNRAERVIETLERLNPGDVETLIRRAQLAERRGQVDRGIELMRAAVSRRPSWDTLIELAQMELKHGQVAAARGNFEKALQLAPGNPYALSSLGELELLYGQPDRAAAVYADLVDRGLADDSELNNLGVAYLLLGDYERARQALLRALELRPTDSGKLLNLADVELLMGNESRAKELYRQVVELETPVTGDDWQKLTRQAQAFAHLGERQAALEAAQRALRLAPEVPWALYTGALVYTLVGDRASALLYAQKARAMGIHAHWFALPWFDPLRAEEEFQQLIAEDNSRR